MIDLKKICNVLERNRCIEHNEKPKASVRGNSINLSTCCDKFGSELQRKIEKEIAIQTEETIKNMFKKFK